MPEESGCVRMTCPIGGYRFTPVKNNPNKCDVDLVIEADLMGNIPGYVQKHVIKDSAYGLHVIKSLLPKYIEENKKKT